MNLYDSLFLKLGLKKAAGEWLTAYTADPSWRALGRVRWAADPNADGKENNPSPPLPCEMGSYSLEEHRLVTISAELPGSRRQDLT